LKYHLAFSTDEQAKFKKLDVIGIPIAQLKDYLDNHYGKQTPYVDVGIPYKSNNSELADWILFSRKAYQEKTGHFLITLIKGDKDAMYPQIKQVINVLQQQNIN